MKLVKTLLATTLALTAFSTFAAKEKAAPAPVAEEQVVVSTQEQPAATDETQAAGQPTTQSTSESAAEAPATPAPQGNQ